MKCGIICLFLLYTAVCKGEFQTGPDPWQTEKIQVPAKLEENDLPPDLRAPLKKEKPSEPKYGFGEWLFKRLLAIIIKSGKVKENEDGSIDVSLQMRFDEDKWAVLDECLRPQSTLSDVMFRRAVGYLEEAIYKPTITEQIVTAWSDYIQAYLIDYKIYITWSFGVLGAVGILIWLWKNVSHKHIIVIIFIFLYFYEVFISYKEAEQKEYERFMSAMNTCKWHFWTNDCNVPAPDPIVFMKHMNPLKIVIRMLTSLISEPILAINSTVKVSLQDITDGLWFPFDKIVYGFLIVIINISLIYLLIMMVFNFIFNIPFKFNFLSIFSICIPQIRRSLYETNSNNTQPTQQSIQTTDNISNETLKSILDVCTLALSNGQNRPSSNTNMQLPCNNTSLPKLTRSASTGRLSTLRLLDNNNDKFTINDNLKRRNRGGGDGDNKIDVIIGHSILKIS